LARAQRIDPVVALLADLDPLEAVVVEQGLQPVDVLLGLGLARRATVYRDVLVGAVGSVARLIEGDRADRDEQGRDDGREDRVDEQDRWPTRNPEPRQVADERIERERDDARGQKQEEDVPERSGEQ